MQHGWRQQEYNSIYGSGVPGVGDGAVAQRVNAYLDSLGGWTLALKFNEATGNIINYGSDGGTGTVTGCTQGQAGQLGAGEAYLFDGVDDVVTFANAALPATKALTTQRWVFLLYASSAGESSQGVLFTWADLINNYTLRLTTSNRIVGAVDCVTTDALAITSTGISLNTWTLVFMDFDAANTLALGRKIRIITATAASAAALITLSTDTAGVGNVVPNAGVLNIGNRSLGDSTLAGWLNFGRAGNGQNGLWSPDATPLDLTRCEQLRKIVFGV